MGVRYSSSHLWVRVEGGEAALENPDLVNTEPYAGGWLLRVRMDDPSEVDDLIPEEE